MARTIGVDFGTSNSVVAVWDEGLGHARVPVLEGISREMRYRLGDEWQTVQVVPSLIGYEGQAAFIGEQVFARGLNEASGTFRWMKGYISARQPLPRTIPDAEPCTMHIDEGTCRECIARMQGGRVCNYVAARDFLDRVFTLYLADLCDLANDEFVFTLPVETYEHYNAWISEVVDRVGLGRYRVLDEPTACVLGYEEPVQQGKVFAVVDFGGGTLDVSVVRIDLDSPDARKCTVLGKAGAPIGGRNITQWLYEDFLERCGAGAHSVGDLSTQILMEVEAAKERLSFEDEVSINVLDPDTGKLYAADYRRGDLETIIRERGLLSRIQEVLEAALNDAEDRAGLRRRDLARVLLVGGSTLIPAVRAAFELMFGDRLACRRPFTAVAAGACRFAAASDLVEWIQHDYAIRHYRPDTGAHEFEPLVERGTEYPSDGPVGRLSIAAVYDGQTEFGVDIYELGERRTVATDQIAFDERGQARVVRGESDNHHYCINEDVPTFLEAHPPGKKGEHRFDLTFTVDGNKRLLMTAMDLATRELKYVDYPVAKLK